MTTRDAAKTSTGGQICSCVIAVSVSYTCMRQMYPVHFTMWALLTALLARLQVIQAAGRR